MARFYRFNLFYSSYSLEVKYYIQGESTFLDICLSFVKIKLILYFYITLHIEPEDPVECKYSRFHSSLQVEEYFCFTRCRTETWLAVYRAGLVKAGILAFDGVSRLNVQSDVKIKN